MSKHYPPIFKEQQFNCVHCGVYAKQYWSQLHAHAYMSNYFICRCEHCDKKSLWKSATETILDPMATIHLPAHEDMPEEIKSLYNEALGVVDLSPKSAGALLRLAIQHLMPLIGVNTGKLDKDIAKLVSEGLNEQVQQALDYCRVIGNNAVHPNEISLDDTPDMVHTMFEMINFIIEEKIAKPNRIKEIFKKLPLGAIASIEKRDNK